MFSRHVQLSIPSLFPLCAVPFCLCAFNYAYLALLHYFIVILSVCSCKMALDITHICSLQYTGTFSSDLHDNRSS